MQTTSKDKKIVKYWLLISVAIFLIVVTFVLSLIFVDFKNQILVTILSIAALIILSFFLMFVLLVKLIPYKQFNKWNKMMNSFEKQTLKGKLVQINKSCTFKNIGECKSLIINVDDKKINKFLPNKINSLDLKLEQEYSFVIKDIYIVEIKEESNEE